MKTNNVLFIIAVTVMGMLLVAQAGIKQATICTTYGDDIYDYQLDQYIDSVIPPSAKRLIVLTQCYGGDCVDNFTGTNTAVVSATSAGQTAKYGGYDDDAANACCPGAGRTGQSVHDAGTNGKHSSETPSTGGGLAPGAVSLEPVTADGAVRSRHVVVYAGMPDAKGRDNAQRDKIKANFAGQTNTTVTTVGGEGPADGWDKHGWGRGLKDAINEAAAAIEAAPDPSKEQFLLFVTDHGDLHNVEHVTTPAPPSNSVVIANVAAFVSADFQERQLDRPGFSITVDIAPFTHDVGDPTDYTPFFPTNAWRLRLTPPPPAEPVMLTAFEERFIEWEDGIVGNRPEEGVRLFFPVDPTLFVDSFFDITYDVEIFNDTPDLFEIMTFSQDTGPVAKGDSEPGFTLITENTVISENDMTIEGHEVFVDGCTLTLDGVHVLERLVLMNNSTVTHLQGSQGLALTVLNDVAVPAGSKIDASAKGLTEREGTTGRSGGSHGGRGQQVSGGSCPVYGSAEWPTDPGAGGRYSEMGYIGWSRGGGRVQIRADAIDLDGQLLANGENGAKYMGGGAGGSILIEAGTLIGVGVIKAEGGSSGNGSGAGGGGRVAIYYDDASGINFDNVSAAGSEGAGPGSVLLKDRQESFARLKVDNCARAYAADIPTMLAIDNEVIGQMSIGPAVRMNLSLGQPAPLDNVAVSGAWITCEGDFSGRDFMVTDTDWTQTGTFGFSNLVTLAGASILRHGAGYEDGLRIHAATVSVASASSINVAGRGRWPVTETTGRSGGSYGGRGEWYVGQSCATFGDYMTPDETGTGGRSSSNASRGGGFVGITADALVLDGVLDASGQAGPQYTGGGSGGGVMISVRNLSGNGTVRANGGNCGPDSSYGGGGGGRVAVYCDEVSGFDLSAIECAGGSGGGAGTVYARVALEASGSLKVDNLGRTHNSAIPTVMVLESGSVDRLAVGGKARLDLTVTEPLDLNALTASGGYVLFTGTIRGADFTVTDTDWTQTGTFAFSNLVALGGISTLRHGAGYAEGLQIQAGTVTVAPASAIDVSARGTGPKVETTGRSGGSYGGLGQAKYGSACPVYGDPYAPGDLGSGGVGSSGRLSTGGGRLKITADMLILDGALRANGQNGGQYTGGGSGGAIWVDAGVLSGSGSLQANGGSAGADGGGAGGGGRVAVYAEHLEGFTPSASEAKAGGDAAQWGTVFMGVPRTVAVACTGQGVCNPAGPVTIAYEGMEPFMFNPVPLSLATNGAAIPPAVNFEWVNNGLWRGTLDDVAWTARLTGNETIEAVFEALQCGSASALPGGGVTVSVNGLAGWRYTLERRESLAEGEWEPVTGQTEILCTEFGALVLTDAAVLPRAFYRVVSEAP